MTDPFAMFCCGALLLGCSILLGVVLMLNDLHWLVQAAILLTQFFNTVIGGAFWALAPSEHIQ